MILVRFSELGKLDGTHENVIGGQGMFAKVWQGMSGPDLTPLNGEHPALKHLISLPPLFYYSSSLF